MRRKRKNFSEWREDEWLSSEDLKERKRYKPTKRRIDEARRQKQKSRDKMFDSE